MKIKRYKKVHKHINFYINNFGFRQPYQILVDGTFCFTALNNKINIADNIPRYLQGEIKLLTTQCAIMEMENLGSKLAGALMILKKYAVHRCGHEGKPVTASKCLLSMVGKKNDDHYVIATQDRELQERVRNIPGVPLLYLHIKTPVLEQPSEVSLKVSKDKLSNVTVLEKEMIEKLKEANGLLDKDEKPKKRKRKGGPNPLSCLKKKKKADSNSHGKVVKITEKTETRKRKKIRIAKHVKEELLKNK